VMMIDDFNDNMGWWVKKYGTKGLEGEGYWRKEGTERILWIMKG
jgi:hypothetical protein